MLDADVAEAEAAVSQAESEAKYLRQKLAVADAREGAMRRALARRTAVRDVLRPVVADGALADFESAPATGDTPEAFDAALDAPGPKWTPDEQVPSDHADAADEAVTQVSPGGFRRRRLPSVRWVTEIVAEAGRALTRQEIEQEMDLRKFGVGAWKDRSATINTAISRARDNGHITEAGEKFTAVTPTADWVPVDEYRRTARADDSGVGGAP